MVCAWLAKRYARTEAGTEAGLLTATAGVAAT